MVDNKQVDQIALSLPVFSGTELPINTLTKKQFLDEISSTFAEYSDLNFSKEELQEIAAELRKLAHGSQAAAPMRCAGKDCPLADRCVFIQMNKAPVGRSCSYEAPLLQYWRARYLEDYNVDPNDFTEVGMISELAEVELYLWRLNTQLGRPGEAMLVTEQVIGVSPKGAPIYQQVISPFLEVKEKLLARKSKLVKLLVGDRQEKYKKQAALKTREETDPASLNTEMRKLMESLVDKQKGLTPGSSQTLIAQKSSSSDNDDGYVDFKLPPSGD